MGVNTRINRAADFTGIASTALFTHLFRLACFLNNIFTWSLGGKMIFEIVQIRIDKPVIFLLNSINV